MNAFNLVPEQVKSVNYVTYNMTSNELDAELFRVTADWCSLTSNWNTKIPIDEKIIRLPAEYGVMKFDITEIAKTYIQDNTGELQRNGLLMKSDSDKYNVLSSHDSTLYPSRTEIIFK